MSSSKTQMDGNLLKFTNLIKGYQSRYFIIDSKTSTLNYFIVIMLLYVF